MGQMTVQYSGRGEPVQDFWGRRMKTQAPAAASGPVSSKGISISKARERRDDFFPVSYFCL